MKQQHSTAVPAVLTAMGVILSWTNLRFPGTVPTGIKLLFLFLLMLLWLAQIGMEKFSSGPLAAHKLNWFSTGVAAAFYGLGATESCRLFRIHHQPVEDWLLLAVTMLIAVVIFFPSLTIDSGDHNETDRT